MSASLTNYEGLQVVDPDPTGVGGLAIQDNFKKLADWQVVGVKETLNTPPVSPVLGDRYLVGSSPSGAWLTPTDRSNQVALWDGSAWAYSTPQSVFNADEQRLYLRNDLTSPIQADALGNARGTAAVDMQGARSAVTQVASGNHSAIGGGQKNTASGPGTVVGGGGENTASGDHNTVSGGYGNSASGYYISTVSGGYSNTASGDYNSTIGGGSSNTASADGSTVSGGVQNAAVADYSTVSGGYFNYASGAHSMIPGGHYSTTDKYGQFAHAAGRFAATGDAQVSTLVARNNTTNATATDLCLDGSSSRLTIPTDTAWAFEAHLIAAQQGMANIKEFLFKGAIVNDNGTTSLSSQSFGTDQTIGSPGAWTVSITADNTNDALDISVTGAAATNIRWVARVTLTEVSYPA